MTWSPLHRPFDRAYSWIARAVSRKLVTVDALRAVLAARKRVRWRAWLNDALEDANEGVYSSLERRYVRDVERAHGLPKSQHQTRRQLGGKVQYRDNLNLALDDVKTHRFGPVSVTESSCETAALVAATLRRNGWDGSARPSSFECCGRVRRCLPQDGIW